jgi:hypothetical protein
MIYLQQDHQPLLMMVELVHLHLLLIMVELLHLQLMVVEHQLQVEKLSISITLLKILLMTMETMEVPLKLKEDLLQAVHQQQSVVPPPSPIPAPPPAPAVEELLLPLLGALLVLSLLVVSVRTLLVEASFVE